MATKRDCRQGAVREIVREHSIRTQNMLVEHLRSRGFYCTQATASRDIAEMGLCKLPEGVYALSEDLQLRRVISERVERVHRAGNLVILKSHADGAAEIASALDGAALPFVLGTIAGIDTVLAIASSSHDGERLEQYLAKLCRTA